LYVGFFKIVLVTKADWIIFSLIWFKSPNLETWLDHSARVTHFDGYKLLLERQMV
jgi:hypothetical protein